MIYLSTLSPAEIYMLIKPNIQLKELLKITLADLFLRKVLKSFEVSYAPHPRDAKQTYKYVVVGENFKPTISKGHEKYFLSVFELDNQLQILFKNLVKVSFQLSGKTSAFRNKTMETVTLNKCFTQNFVQKLLSIYSISDYGKQIKHKVELEIKNLNAEFSNVNGVQNEKAKALIKNIGGNILLIPNFNYELLTQIDAEFLQEITRNNNSNSSDSGCSSVFDGYSSSFDSGCGSDGGASSGCGGSGCGGCGGCGG